MSDRGQPGVDGPPACPFIAFEDERDERSSSPDHRHRCYAEVRPAPRAAAHQEAYCLSSAFPVCPTFQDWARREAAQARSSGRAAAAPPIGAAVAAEAMGDDAAPEPEPEPPPAPVTGSGPDPEPDDVDPWSAPPDNEPPARRNPPRDWAAPPPWASGGAPAAASSRAPGDVDDRPPDFLASRSASQGLAGSAADRLAAGQPAVSPSTPAAPASDELAGLVAPAAVAAASRSTAPPLTRPPTGAYPTTTASGRRPTVSSTRDRNRPVDHSGPSWEQAKRYEAYPTIKTRAGLPGIPRIAVWAGALGVAALALFFLPALLGFGGGGAGSSPSPSPSAVATASPSPTPVPEPTAQTYTIKKGDTLNKIAKKFDVTVAQLLAANKKTIKDADKIKVGQEIVIPVPIPEEFTDPDAAAPSDEEPTPEP